MSRILVVCTGNINRSALTAALLQRSVGDVHMIRSAGLTADGMEPPAKMIAAADAAGIDLRSHRSRLVTAPDIDGADLVICMDRTHPVRLASVSPAAQDKTFLMTELIGRLQARAGAGGDLTSHIAAMAAERPPTEFLSPPFDDVPDPQGRGKRHFRNATEIIVGLADQLSPMLREYAHR